MQGEAVAKRSPRAGRPARKKQEVKPVEESRPVAPLERHSGEGSASALEMLQRLEDRHRLQTQAPPPAKDADEGGS